jgi:membrane-associated phospholipid phosphatase
VSAEEPGRGESVARRGDAASNGYDVVSKTLHLDPADKVVIAYLAIIALLILTFSYRIESWGWFCALHAILIAIVLSLARLEHSALRRVAASPRRPFALPSPPSLRLRVASFVHGWYPVALMFVTYKELTFLIPRIHPRDFDATLAAFDYRLLGVNPTVWLERFTWPPLTEILQLTYSTYYFLPIILGAVLWSKGWFDKFRFWVFIVVLGFYLSYLGYIAVPAIGPRFLSSIVAAQTKPLTGVLFFSTIREALDRAEGITRDCFPSGHSELTLLVLYYAHKFHRKTFWWLLPVGTGITISTVYLRYHYAVDVAAGALLAVAVVLIAKPLYGLVGGKLARRGV